jgi:hypothetical protein
MFIDIDKFRIQKICSHKLLLLMTGAGSIVWYVAVTYVLSAGDVVCPTVLARVR